MHVHMSGRGDRRSIPGHPQPHNEFEVSLGNMRLFQKAKPGARKIVQQLRAYSALKDLSLVPSIQMRLLTVTFNASSNASGHLYSCAHNHIHTHN